MLQLNEQNRIPEMDHCYICGELALSGELRPVRGTLAVALEARKRRRERLIVPHQNAAEAEAAVVVKLTGRNTKIPRCYHRWIHQHRLPRTRCGQTHYPRLTDPSVSLGARKKGAGKGQE